MWRDGGKIWRDGGKICGVMEIKPYRIAGATRSGACPEWTRTAAAQAKQGVLDLFVHAWVGMEGMEGMEGGWRQDGGKIYNVMDRKGNV
jgi:hypothetical protein